MSVDFRIMAVKSRREKYVLDILSSIGKDESIVTYDKEGLPKNPMRNAKATWLKDTTCTHVCVLQDDVEPCKYFTEIVNICAEMFPFAVFSFYNPRLTFEDTPKDTPYLKVPGSGMYGPAIMIPKAFIKPMFYWGDCVYGEDFPHDDTVIGFFCEVHKIPVMTTIPGIVQHLGCSDSFMGYNNKKKVSRVYDFETLPDKFKTNKFGVSKYIPNTKIEPKGGYKTGTLKSLSEIIGGMK